MYFFSTSTQGVGAFDTAGEIRPGDPSSHFLHSSFQLLVSTFSFPCPVSSRAAAGGICFFLLIPISIF